MNSSFEELPSARQDLTFDALGAAMRERLGISRFDGDTLRTLGLLSDGRGYNNAAAILADGGGMPGVDMARFGESTSVILRRETLEGASALEEFGEAVRVFGELYCHEEVSGAERRRVERVPLAAFREALANALVHRTWDVSARVRVSMHDDRVEVSSPGGLPAGISEEEYLSDMVSVRRNPILANVFYRLGIVEAFGTGILRIRESYAGSASRPRFEVAENSVRVVLPVLERDLGLTGDQALVYGLLSPVRAQSAGDLHAQVSFSRSKLGGILRGLVAGGLARTTGAGRGLRYLRS